MTISYSVKTGGVGSGLTILGRNPFVFGYIKWRAYRENFEISLHKGGLAVITKETVQKFSKRAQQYIIAYYAVENQADE